MMGESVSWLSLEKYGLEFISKLFYTRFGMPDQQCSVRTFAVMGSKEG